MSNPSVARVVANICRRVEKPEYKKRFAVEVDESNISLWQLSFFYENAGCPEIVVEMVLAKENPLKCAPHIHIKSPRIKGPDIFDGTVCLQAMDSNVDLSTEDSVISFLTSLRDKLDPSDPDMVIQQGEYSEDEHKQGLRHILVMHPDWKLVERTRDGDTLKADPNEMFKEQVLTYYSLQNFELAYNCLHQLMASKSPLDPKLQEVLEDIARRFNAYRFIPTAERPNKTMYLVGGAGAPACLDGFNVQHIQAISMLSTHRVGDGDVVRLAEGFYYLWQFWFLANITIEGVSRERTILIAQDGLRTSAQFLIRNLAIRDLQSRGGYTSTLFVEGGGSLHLQDVHIESPAYGVRVENGSVRMERCYINAQDRPLVAKGGGEITALNCKLEGGIFGAIFHEDSRASFEGCSLSGSDSALVSSSSGLVHAKKCKIAVQRHGVRAEIGSRVSLTDCTVDTPDIALLCWEGAVLRVENCAVNGRCGVDNSGECEVANSRFRRPGEVKVYTNGILNNKKLKLTKCTIHGYNRGVVTTQGGATESSGTHITSSEIDGRGHHTEGGLVRSSRDVIRVPQVGVLAEYEGAHMEVVGAELSAERAAETKGGVQGVRMMILRECKLSGGKFGVMARQSTVELEKTTVKSPQCGLAAFEQSIVNATNCSFQGKGITIRSERASVVNLSTTTVASDDICIACWDTATTGLNKCVLSGQLGLDNSGDCKLTECKIENTKFRGSKPAVLNNKNVDLLNCTIKGFNRPYQAPLGAKTNSINTKFVNGSPIKVRWVLLFFVAVLVYLYIDGRVKQEKEERTKYNTKPTKPQTKYQYNTHQSAGRSPPKRNPAQHKTKHQKR